MKTFATIIREMSKLLSQLKASQYFMKKDANKLPKQGIYVFYNVDKPIYVGRSNNIPSRIRGHSTQSASHNTASFGYRLAWERAARRINIEGKTRNQLMKTRIFRKIYNDQLREIAKMRIKAVKIEGQIEQTIFEVYASMELKTKYNYFNTH